MLIKTTLLAEDRPLVEGLLNGTLKRFGGVVREVATGRIVRHLLEAPATSDSFMRLPPLNLVGGAVNAVINGVGHGITHQKLGVLQATLGSVLQVSQIAAAASVLNLGVSVVGFAYMGYKLNQLQRSMSELQGLMGAGFQRLEGKLDGLSDQLNYLLFLAEASLDEQRQISLSIAELNRSLLVGELAGLLSWLDHLSRFPQDSPKEAIRTASKVRITLSDQALRISPRFETQTMLVADVSIRGWMLATATEANLLLVMGHHKEARQLIESERPQFTRLAENWADALISSDRPKLATAYRFRTPRFGQHILPERVERIAWIHSRDRHLTPEKRESAADEASIELEMSRSASLGARWVDHQLVIAEFLDGLSELDSRLGSIAEFAWECERRELSSSLDVLPPQNARSGIHVFCPVDDE